MLVLRILIFLAGAVLVGLTLYSAIETLVLPRSAPDRITRTVFLVTRRIFDLRMKRMKKYEERDRVMAFYAPAALMLLLPAWAVLIMLGYMGMYWGLGGGSWYQAFVTSGSSIFTLGYARVDGLPLTVLVFSEAMIGLILVALLIAYLPTMYSAFSRRENAVTLLEVRAGSPPSAIDMLERYYRIHGLQALEREWAAWEVWFADIEESHTSLPALVFFRSHISNHSWVTASGAVLDTASLSLSTLDIPFSPAAALCIRAGYLSLRRIAEFFEIEYNPEPHFPADPISIRREEFNETYNRLKTEGLPVKADCEQAWIDFAGWRVNYDAVLEALCEITMAPQAPWSSDRSAKIYAHDQGKRM